MLLPACSAVMLADPIPFKVRVFPLTLATELFELEKTIGSPVELVADSVTLACVMDTCPRSAKVIV